MRWARASLDLLAVLAWAALATAAAWVAVPDWARAVLDLPLVFLLPGYAMTSTLLRRGTLSRSERLAYAAALSIAVSILTGVVIGLVFVLDREAWTISLGAITAAAAFGALLARRGPAGPKPARAPWPSPITVVIVGLAVAVAAAAIVIASTGAREARSRAHFTALSILPATDASGGRLPVSVAVENRTGGTGRFELKVSQAGHPLLRRSLVLEDGARWVRRVPASTPTSANPVTATLLRQGRVYRRVYLRSGLLR
jgi:Protein of unknown function (DUF1616)